MTDLYSRGRHSGCYYGTVNKPALCSTLSLSNSKAVCYTNIWKQLVWNKGHQYLCLEDVQKPKDFWGMVFQRIPSIIRPINLAFTFEQVLSPPNREHYVWGVLDFTQLLSKYLLHTYNEKRGWTLEGRTWERPILSPQGTAHQARKLPVVAPRNICHLQVKEG